MNKRPIGFTQEIAACKEEEPKKKSSAWKPWIGIAVICTGIYWAGSTIIESHKSTWEGYEEYASQKNKEKSEKKKEAAKNHADTTQKQMAKEYVASKVEESQYTIIQKFNEEINSTEENKIFRSEFKIGTKALLMIVDVDHAAEHFGVTTEVARLGIVQGSGNYRGYLERFRNTEGNGNKVLHIVDKDGKIISEVY